MKKLSFLLMIVMFAVINVFSQTWNASDCPDGHDYARTCAAGPGQWDDCKTGYSPWYNKKDEKPYRCRCDAAFKAEEWARQQRLNEKRNAQTAKTAKKVENGLDSLGKVVIGLDDEVGDLVKDVDSIKTAIKNLPPATPAFTFSNPPPAPPPAPKKDSVKAKKPDTYGKSFLPEIMVFGETNRNPIYDSRFLWGVTGGLEAKIIHWKSGISFHAVGGFLYMPSKNLYTETTPSPKLRQLSNSMGFNVQMGAAYEKKFYKIGLDVSWAITNDDLPHQGAILYGEFGTEKFPLKLRAGAIYRYNLEGFVGIVWRLQPKA